MSNLEQSEVDALLAEAELLATEVSGKPAPDLVPATTTGAIPGPPTPMPENLPVELHRILQLEVPVIVQLADRYMEMADVLALNVGSVIEFDKKFDAELELVVSDRQIGLGHAVKVGENFGLRITRIGTIYDTIRALGGH
ncbi:MAG: FliM/FliN family flagellar motor switch protein [Planctomycetes bacterium]|nr:FliM/FliN family flagellar motor switch protein [Planctomycetota bacterium]